jgi:hypothetical protein
MLRLSTNNLPRVTAAVAATLGLAALALAAGPRPAARPKASVLAFPLPPGESLTIDPNNSFPAPPDRPNFHGMTTPHLMFVFYGPTWATRTGRANEKALLQSVQDILNGGYLDGMAQYGLRKVTFNPATDFIEEAQGELTIADPLPRNNLSANQTALQTFLQAVLPNHNIRTPQPGDDWRTSTVFVVVGDCTSAGTAGAAGYGENDPWTADVTNPRSNSLAEMIWIGWDANQPRGPHGEFDGTTSLFSHELVEATSGVGLTVVLPGGRQPDGDQIADNDAATHRGRLAAAADGRQILVQSFFSASTGDFVIPGGVVALKKGPFPARHGGWRRTFTAKRSRGSEARPAPRR